MQTRKIEKIKQIKAAKVYNLWRKEGRGYILLFSGTESECEEELEEYFEEDHPDFKIEENGIADNWENEVEKEIQTISLERAKKYARHQHFLGTQGKDLVEFEDWKK